MSKINPSEIFVNNEIIRQIVEQLEIARDEIAELQAKVSTLMMEEFRETAEKTIAPRKGRPAKDA